MKNQNYKSRFKIIPFWVVTFLIFFHFRYLNEARAQSLSLNLYPPLLEVTIQPGKSITQVYKLANSGESDLILTCSIIPFVPTGELGNINLDNSQPSNWPSSSWFSFQNADLSLGEKFLLKAGKTQEIVLKIKIPQSAPEDDYYQTLLFETTPENYSGRFPGSQAQVKIGANILVTVSQTGEPLKRAKIEQFALVNSRFFNRNSKFFFIDSFTPVKFLFRLKNIGRVFFKPMGTISVKGWFGQKESLDLLPENVLVNSIRQIQCQAKETFGPCSISNKFFLGSYTVFLEFGLDQPSQDYTQKITFIALPLKLFIAILLIIILLYTIKNKLKLVLDKVK